MSPHQRDATQHAKVRRRRYRKAQERLARGRRQAQRAAEALQQALEDLGLPEDLVTELEGRLRSQKKLLSKIVGVMCPPLFGCRTNAELCRVRGWDKNLPSCLLGVLPKRSWLKRLRRVATIHAGVLMVEGKSTYVFALPDGRQVKGHELQQHREWPWRQSEQVPEVRYARLRAIRPTYGAVTLIVIEAPGEQQFYLMCLATAISGPRLIRAWKRRHWIEYCFRTVKHLLATGACQVHREDAYYGHLVLRLIGCLVLFYASRVVCKGQLTMEEIIFSLKHYWRFVDSEALELKALSQGMDEKAA